jgi:hypothetical protein
MSLPAASADGQPPDDREPGWHPHPKHPTVQRYWNGAAWTGEHRFAPTDDPGAELMRTADRLAAHTDDAGLPNEGAIWLAGGFGLPLVYFAGAWIVAEGIDDCSADTEANVALVVGVFLWLAAVAAVERGLRLLDVRMWLRVIVVAVSGLYSAYVVYIGLIVIALSAWCFGC